MGKRERIGPQLKNSNPCNHECNTVHINEVEGIKPESIAFVSYVLKDYSPYTQLFGEVVNVPFLACHIGFVMYFVAETDDGVQLVREASVIFNKHGEALSLLARTFFDGKLNPDTIELCSFVMRPYSQDVVIDFIKNLKMIIDVAK